MSTRSQIRFIEEYEGDIGTVRSQVYRHSDGYPKGILPDLMELKELLEDTMTLRDGSYTASNFIFLCKLRGMRFYLDRDEDAYGGNLSPESPMELTKAETFKEVDQPHFLLGYGVEDPEQGIHGDEEWLYVVEIDRVEGPAGMTSSVWNVKISNNFPTWDENTEDAFEEAEWEFEGTLSEALDKYMD